MAAFTTIATAAGLAISAASAGGGFLQAGKQRKRQEEAERQGKKAFDESKDTINTLYDCLLYTSPSPRDLSTSRMPSSA